MIKQIKSLWIPLVILVLITLLLALWYFVSDSQDVRNFCLSLGTCFLSAIIVAIFFDIYISARAHREKLETASACVRAIKPALTRLANVYFNLLKATSLSAGNKENIDVVDVFNLLDVKRISVINGKLEAPVLPARSWNTYFADANIDFAMSLERFVEKYAVHLDANTIDLCETLANHGVIGSCKNSRLDFSFMPTPDFQLPIFQITTGPTEDAEGVTLLDDFLTKLKHLINLAQAAGDKPLEMAIAWSNNVAPAVGALVPKEMT